MAKVHEAWAETGKIAPPPGFEPYSLYQWYLAEYIRGHTKGWIPPPWPDQGKESKEPWLDIREDPPRFMFKMEHFRARVNMTQQHDLNVLRMQYLIKQIRGGGNFSGSEHHGERRKRGCWWVPLTPEEVANCVEYIRALEKRGFGEGE
jgi:hypothetical protein